VRVLPQPAVSPRATTPSSGAPAARLSHSARPGAGVHASETPTGAPRQPRDDTRGEGQTALRIADIVQPVQIETVLPDERAALDQIDIERRLRLLRIIAPGLLVVILLALPFAIQSDVMSHSFASVPQVLIGLAGALPATWGTFRRKLTVATLGFFLGVTGVIVLLVLQDGPLSATRQFTLMSVLDFAELAIPIAVAGVLGSPRLVLAATGGAVVFTVGVLLLTPHDATLMSALQSPGGLAIFTIPLSTLVMLGLLLFAATNGYRRTQRELGAFRIAYARERELDRLKNQFISNVNHELRTPIMALQGYIELARALGARSPASQDEMLARGGETTDYLAGLVRAILNVRRIEDDAANITPEVFALRPVILSATNLLDPRAGGERQRDLHLRVPDDLKVYADPERVRQVMVNLLSNANKYSPEGSPIEITARVAPAQPQRGARAKGAPGAQARPMVEVAVRDYGLGVPPEQAVLLFQRFVRLERDIASNVLGSGLGLAICRAYVEAMGGRIWVESTGQSGDGSTFTFTLPLG